MEGYRPPPTNLRDALNAWFREMGLLNVVPWATLASFLLVGAGLSAGFAVSRFEVGLDGTTGPYVALMAMWPLLGVGGVLALAAGVSGTVASPAGRALGGLAAGLVAVGALVAAQVVAFALAVVEAPPIADVVVGALVASVAGSAAPTWARLRYDATPIGVAVVSMWALGVGFAPVVALGVLRVTR